MKYFIGYFFLIFSFLDTIGSSDSYGTTPNLMLVTDEDSIPGKRPFGTLKISPHQILASEIPVSLEMYISGDMSLQVQAGYIFRTEKIANWLEQTGPGGGVAEEGLFNYRTIPYNNDAGMNFKLEFRKYFRPIAHLNHTPYREYYLAPQITYKYCYYNNQTFMLDPSGLPYYQKESKDTKIFGLGFILGRQSCEDRLVTDWFGGIGFRHRGIKAFIHEKWPYSLPHPLPIYDNQEYQNSFYLFVNFNVRFGYEL